MKVVWDDVGERFYETGIDRAVLYLPGGGGVPWNGLTSVDEDAGGVSVEEFYFNGVKYLELRSSGDFSGSLKAYTYPEEFEEFDGLERVTNGMLLANQPVLDTFGLSYRTRVGNDVDGIDHGYKIHVFYNLTAVPDTKGFASLSDQVSPTDLSWTISSVPEIVSGHRPTAHAVFDTRKMDPFLIRDLEKLLYGQDSIEIPPIELDLYDGGSVGYSSPDELDGGTAATSDTGGGVIISETEPQLPSLADLTGLVTTWVKIDITDNGDGTWTAEGPDELITMLDPTTFQIEGAAAEFLDADTYQIQTTSGFGG